MKLEDMSWDEAVKKCRGKVILVPHGSTEEHGYHLPLKTDALSAEKVCAEFYGSKTMIVAPVIAYAGLHATKQMPGTIGPNPEEYKKWIVTIVSDFMKLKPKKVIFFLGHDGRTARRAFKKAKKRFRRIEYFGYHEGGKKAIEREIISSTGHAGEGETSLMLYLDRKNVKMARAVDERWPKKGVSKSGVDGWPSKATATKGKKLFKLYVEMVKEALDK
ncbi:MAG: creatininase family protein [Candidatus Micrarchaeota archaeon]